MRGFSNRKCTLKKKVIDLEKKFVSVEVDTNSLEQCKRQNDIDNPDSAECWSEILLFGIYNYYSWQVTAELKVARSLGVVTAVIKILQSKITVWTFSTCQKYKNNKV